MRIYSLYDRKVGEFQGLVVSPNDETVKRALKEGLPANSTEAKYPHDFDLKCLGEFDVTTGRIKPLADISVLGSIHDITGGV